MADGSDPVLALVWSALLDFFAAGASVFFLVAVHLQAAAGCAVECEIQM